MFDEFLAAEAPFDFALIGTVMTYWYPGVREVIECIRRRSPRTGIVLGGPYATLCPDHAKGLGADLVVQGTDLSPLWSMLGLAGDENQPPLWEAYPSIHTGAMRLTWGCPFRCTYCCVPKVYPTFTVKPPAMAQTELDLMISLGAQHVAFYDDALLHRPQEALVPFLEYAVSRDARPRFHTPNAINARLLTPDLAGLMVRAGFGKIYLGFESASSDWQQSTGGKVRPHELAAAVEMLTAAGASRCDLAAYILLGHPHAQTQAVEDSMMLASKLGIGVMLAEFSPIPGTPDGELLRGKGAIDLDEPLWHNKTACAIATLGQPEVDRLKQLCRDLNSAVRQSHNCHHKKHEDHQEHQERKDKWNHFETT
jgi:pyruvate-formate lyase-activating enzyme